MITTQGFDIYFPESLSREAQRLATFADAERARIEALLSMHSPHTSAASPGEAAAEEAAAAAPAQEAATPQPKRAPVRKIPVLLTDASPWLNGYSTFLSSERIVIQLSPASYTGQLAGVSDELKLVFVHELTHSLSLAKRSPFWGLMAAAMGDPVLPSGLVMPASMVEGLAVYVESKDGEGRLNDPVALRPVYNDIRARIFRSLQEVSGLNDKPGSGAQPYLYGGLFNAYLAQRFGEKVLAALWHEASGGNIFEGFDGTFHSSRGALHKVTGYSADELWSAFLGWLEAGSGANVQGAASADADAEHYATTVETSAMPRLFWGKEMASSLVASGSVLYWVDAEQGAIYSLDLRNALDGTLAAQRQKVLAADTSVDRISLSTDTFFLYVDSVKAGSGGNLIAVRRVFDLANARFIGEVPVPAPPLAAGASAAQGAQPFFVASSASPSGLVQYGLVRIGAGLMAARSLAAPALRFVAPDRAFKAAEPARAAAPQPASIEILDGIPGNLVSIASSTMPLADGSTLLAVSYVDAHSITYVQLFSDTAPGAGREGSDTEGSDGATPLAEGKLSTLRPLSTLPALRPLGKALRFPQGADNVVPIGISWLAFTTDEAAGATVVRLLRIDDMTGAAPRDRASAGWRPWTAPVAMPPLLPPPALPVTRVFLPLLFKLFWYPTYEHETVRINVQGIDIARALSWNAWLGWNVAGTGPESALALQFNMGTMSLGLSVSDRLLGVTEKAWWRLSNIALVFNGTESLYPFSHRISYRAYAVGSAMGKEEKPGTLWTPDRSLYTGALSLEAGYSTLRRSLFPPFDPKGFEAKLRIDMEHIPHGDPAFSIAASLRLASDFLGLDMMLAGAYSFSDDLRFSLVGRTIDTGSGALPSLLGLFWPAMPEYKARALPQPWLVYGELSARLLTLDADPHGLRPEGVRLPLALRRFLLRAGLRAAFLPLPGSSWFESVPTTLFARATVDIAPLLGMASKAHLVLGAEFDLLLNVLLVSPLPFAATAILEYSL